MSDREQNQTQQDSEASDTRQCHVCNDPVERIDMHTGEEMLTIIHHAGKDTQRLPRVTKTHVCSFECLEKMVQYRDGRLTGRRETGQPEEQ